MPDDSTITEERPAPPTSPPPPITLHVDDSHPRVKRPSRAVAFIRGWTDEHLSRDQVSAGVKTLLWVIPLTILIWIYAERQGHAEVPGVTLPVEIVSNDPSKIFTIISPSSKNVVVTLKGPRAAVESVQKQFSQINGSVRARIPFDSTVVSPIQTIRAVRVREDQRLIDANITVVSAEPDEIQFYVDQLVEKEYNIEVADAGRFGTPPKFTPETVKVRGPSRVLNSTTPLRVQADLSAAIGRAPVSDQTLHLNEVKLNVIGAEAGSVVLTPPTVAATVTPVKAKDDQLPVVRVMLAAPKSVLDRYLIEIPGGETIPNVKVYGPEEVISRLIENAPVAFVEVTQAVLTEGDAEVPIQYNLPPGVVLKDERKTLRIRATPR